MVKEKKHLAVSFPAVRSSGSGIYRKYSGYGKYTKASQYSGVVGALYPDFCRIPAEEWKEEQDVEDTQPKYVFWIVEFIKNL